MRGTVHSVCQTSKEDKRAWGLPSALTFSSTSAPLWLCPLRQVSSLSELLIYIVRAMMSALSNSVTAINKYHPRGILVALNGGVCFHLNSCQNQNHTQPAFQEGYVDNPIKPLCSLLHLSLNCFLVPCESEQPEHAWLTCPHPDGRRSPASSSLPSGVHSSPR